MKRVSIAALVLLGGCKEDPSWAARWRIEPRPGMELETTTNEEGELLNSVQCSRVGVSVIRFASVTSPFPECRAFTTQEECGPGPDASDGDTDGGSDTGDDGGGSACRWVPGNPGGCVSAGALADLREKPCFSQALENPNAVLGGPKLVPGLYEVIATATRSNGAAWVECFVADDGEEYCGDEGLIPRCIDTGDGPRCQEGYLSCDCRFIEVKEDVTLRVDDLVLGAPPECEDGIDSDLDGLVDQRDPGCQGRDREDRNVVNAQLVIDFSLLSNHPLVSCTGVGLSEYVVFLDDEEVGRTDCRIGAFGLNLDIEPGEHTIRVEGLGFDGAAATEPQTFDVLALAAGVLDPALLEVDFGDDDFIEPIEAMASFSVGFIPHPDDLSRFCAGAPGNLEIAEVTVQLLDAGGAELSPAPRAVTPSEFAGTRLDGRRMPCVTASITTRPLTWGAYRVAVEGYSPEGELCFTNTDEPTLLAPGAGISVEAGRVLPPPPSCRDCGNDADCGQFRHCDGGVCTPD